MRVSLKLVGKVAIVTGAGRGIGRAIALAFAREGAKVTVAARTQAEIEEVAEQVHRLNSAALAVRTDVSRPDDVLTMVRETHERFGSVDILVNDAGVQGPIGSLDDNDTAEWTESIGVNLVGVFLCSKAVLPIMKARRAGKIINLSGGGAAGPREHFSAYSAAKAGVVRLTECLAEEVRPYNICVNAMSPGACNTQMFREILAAGDRAGAKSVAETTRQLQTGGTALEIPAALAVFLASDESDGLTGRLISAVHDNWRAMAEKTSRISDWAYTLRRIDSHTLKKLNPEWSLPDL